MDISIKMSKDFENMIQGLGKKYGEDFEYLNGFHETQTNFSDFIDGFVDKNVADVTIDANANASNKDIRSLISEKGKSLDKLFAFNKIFYEIKKKYGLATAREWIETEYNGGFYMHDAPSTSYIPYCFSGETKIITKSGIKRLDELVDKDVVVLNKLHGWEAATVKNFGVNKLRKLVLERRGVTKEIYVTGNHRWFVKFRSKGAPNVLITDKLKEGMKIPFTSGRLWTSINPSPFGVAHGYYMGNEAVGESQRVNFVGDKSALIPYFSPTKVFRTDLGYAAQGIPKSFYELPSLNENYEYLLGWLSGFFAATGTVHRRNGCKIETQNKEYIDFARDAMCVIGMPVGEVVAEDSIDPVTRKIITTYRLNVPMESIKKDFLIRPSHRRRYVKDFAKIDEPWIVKSVSETDREEDTYCVVAPITESFTLDNNVLTHNCYAYDLSRLAKEGLFFLKNYNNEPPKHLTTFLDDVVEFISYMSNRSSGAVGIPNILIWTYYFWKKDCEEGYIIKNPEYYIKQSFQKLIYRLNQPFMRILISP